MGLKVPRDEPFFIFFQYSLTTLSKSSVKTWRWLWYVMWGRLSIQTYSFGPWWCIRIVFQHPYIENVKRIPRFNHGNGIFICQNRYPLPIERIGMLRQWYLTEYLILQIEHQNKGGELWFLESSCNKPNAKPHWQKPVGVGRPTLYHEQHIWDIEQQPISISQRQVSRPQPWV